MARALDYQFDNIITKSDGTRKIKNAGALYGLRGDGVDDKILTGWFPSPLTQSGTLFLSLTFHDGDAFDGQGTGSETNKRFYFEQRNGYITVGIGNQNVTTSVAIVLDKEYRIGFTYTSNTVRVYVDGVFQLESAFIWDTGTTISSFALFTFPTHPEYNHNATDKNFQIWHSVFTDAQMQYDFENKETALYLDGLGALKTDNIGVNITDCQRWYPLTEGTGNVTMEMVSGVNADLVNFPADDSQWINWDVVMDSGQALQFQGTQYVATNTTRNAMPNGYGTVIFNHSRSDKVSWLNVIDMWIEPTTQSRDKFVALYDVSGEQIIFAIMPSDLIEVSLLSPVITLEKDYRIAMVMDGSNFILYFDGVQVDIIVYNGTLNNDVQIPTLDLGTWNGGLFAKGTLGNVQVWDYAFTPEQIAFDFANPEKSLYLQSGVLKSDNPNIIPLNCTAWYPLNEGQGDTIHDLTGIAPDCTIAGYVSTMWSDASSLSSGLQNTLLKKTALGVTTGLAGTNSLRFNT